MKKRWLIVLVAALLAVILAVPAFAAETDPGSSGDPVVTKSYVDAQIAALKESLKAETGTNPGTTAPSADASDVFTAVEVKAGQLLIGAGGTELVLRSGSATAIDNGKDGVSDLTGAKDLKGGVQVEKNHLLLVPRDDGRGIAAQTDIWIMVKGAYTIH